MEQLGCLYEGNGITEIVSPKTAHLPDCLERKRLRSMQVKCVASHLALRSLNNHFDHNLQPVITCTKKDVLKASNAGLGQRISHLE